MKMIKLKLLYTFISFLIIFLLITRVHAATEGTVTATVTIGVVSVTISPSNFDYGTMPFSSVKESFDVIDISGDKNIKATVGSLLTDLDIKGSDTTDWSLSSTSIGVNQYMYKYGTSTDAVTRPASYSSLTTSYDNVLASDISANSYIWFGLQMNTPSSGIATQQSASVTVLASWGE